ncbi:hypothetical protein HK102_009358 [Quaeritorhiza haematococci]|nr:hypothetical protein HK102_009358 [Quaeritorhiza haematococci]
MKPKRGREDTENVAPAPAPGSLTHLDNKLLELPPGPSPAKRTRRGTANRNTPTNNNHDQYETPTPEPVKRATRVQKNKQSELEWEPETDSELNSEVEGDGEEEMVEDEGDDHGTSGVGSAPQSAAAFASASTSFALTAEESILMDEIVALVGDEEVQSSTGSDSGSSSSKTGLTPAMSKVDLVVGPDGEVDGVRVPTMEPLGKKGQIRARRASMTAGVRRGKPKAEPSCKLAENDVGKKEKGRKGRGGGSKNGSNSISTAATSTAMSNDTRDTPTAVEETPKPEVQANHATNNLAQEEGKEEQDLAGVYVVGSADQVGFPLGEDVFSARYFTRVPNTRCGEIGAIAAGSQHGVVVSKNGKEVLSFGNNDEGALGRFGPEYFALKVRGLEGLKIKQVVCSDNMTAFLTDEGKVFTCGTFKNAEGKNRYDETTTKQAEPRQVRAFTQKVVHIAAGCNFLLAVTRNEDLYAWGYGDYGQLGHDTESSRTRLQKATIKPYRIGLAEPQTASSNTSNGGTRGARVRFARVYAGSDHGFAIDIHGRCFAFGSNNWGQLGVGDEEVRRQPALVRFFTERGLKLSQISGGNHHTLFLTTNGEVYACGRNDEGQLGIGAVTASTNDVDAMAIEDPQAAPLRCMNLPTRVSAGGLESACIVKVACGTDHSLAIGSEGELFSWGWGDEFMLGTGRRRTERCPVKIDWRVIVTPDSKQGENGKDRQEEGAEDEEKEEKKVAPRVVKGVRAVDVAAACCYSMVLLQKI